jgi:hypothetical protein
MSLQNGYTVLNSDTIKHLISKIKRNNEVCYVRKGSFATDIIWQGRRFVFPNPKKSAKANMWIFKAVIYDVKLFISNHKIHEKPSLPVNFWNEKNKRYRGKITATDLDHAYWRVAFLNEYIRPETYLKGLELKDKSLRLAALANLSSMKEFYIMRDGKVTNETITIKYDPILHKIYNNIRNGCYEHMMNIANILGDEFICYKTDCIYYKDSEENKQIVQTYLDSVAMEWKQLSEPSRPKKEKVDGTNHDPLQKLIVG